ncbi:MAG: hypothetical protein COB40_01650 [Marinosulfonomonas sp.]|nr:MAG: hypothetical protein COB40_01650 [Marinosulfonomonas sp.]
MSKSNTGDQILSIACALLASDGLGAVSFDAIAHRLGRSKQAVLYWFPTKHDLLAAMFVPWLEAEADTAISAVATATNQREAIERFVRAIALFHLGDLNRFRMMYLVPQTNKKPGKNRIDTDVVRKIHPVTDRLYGAFAGHLGADQNFGRKKAVAIHSSVLGLVLMFGLADGLRDPLKHREADMIDTLIASLTGKD